MNGTSCLDGMGREALCFRARDCIPAGKDAFPAAETSGETMHEHQEPSSGVGGAASTYSGYSLHATSADKGINLILSQPGISSSRVTRLSPTAVWALPDPGTELPPRERTLQLLLDAHGRTIGPLRGEIFWSDTRRHDAPIGIQLVDVTLEQGRQILTALDTAVREGQALPAVSPGPVEEAIVNPQRILSVLKAVCVMKHQGLLRQLGRTLRVSLEYFDVANSQLHWRMEEPEGRWGTAPYDIEVGGYNSAFRLRVPALETRGDCLVTPMPKRLWRVRHRKHRRAAAPWGLRVSFQHPLWAELGPRDHEVVDLSFSGLALRGTDDDLAFPGLLLQPLEVWGDGEGEGPILLRGEVRYVGTRQQGQRVLGLHVLPCTPRDEQRWAQLVSTALCPSTRGGDELLAPLWELLGDSGYFKLGGRPLEDFQAQRATFEDTSHRAAHLPRLFCQTVWPSNRGVEATLSSARLYRHGWLVHQLAKRPGKPAQEVPSGQILRDIHVRTLEHAQGQAHFRWLIAYVEATLPLLDRVHLAFARAHEGSEEVLALPVRLARARCDEPRGQPIDGLEVAPARSEERARLVEEIAGARGRPATWTRWT